MPGQVTSSPVERTAVSITTAVTTITAGEGVTRIDFFLEDDSTDQLRYGGPTITTTRGGKLYQGQSLAYHSVVGGFQISFIAESGTQTLQVIEYQ